MPRTTTKPLQPDDLLRLRLPMQPRLSPDGRAVVYVERRADAGRNTDTHALVLVDVESGRSRPLTHGPHSDTAPCWMPDSRHVVFVSDRDGGPNLWRLRVAEAAPRPERLTQLDGQVAAPCVAPDGRRVAFLHAPRSAAQRALDPTAPARGPRYRRLDRLGARCDGRGFRDGAWQHLWVLDSRTGRVRQITYGDWDDEDPAWSPDGRWLTFVSNRIARAEFFHANRDVYVVAARGGRPRRLTEARGPKRVPAWSPDGRRIAFVGHTRWPDTVDHPHVWTVRVRDGVGRDLLPDADLLCEHRVETDVAPGPEPQPPLWSADGRRLFFLASREGETNVWEVDADGGAPRQRSFGRHVVCELSQSRRGERWAFTRLAADSPGDVWVASAGVGAGGAAARRAAADRGRLEPTPAANGSGPAAASGPWIAGARVRRLTHLNDAWLRERRLFEPQEFRVPTGGGHRVHAWMLRAATRGRGPAVLLVHGGPHALYGWSFNFEAQALAGRGCHVVLANVRGSAGYGREFMRAVVGKWGTRDYEDLVHVADAVERLPFVDPARLGVAGESYGGYLTLWTVAHTRRFRCAASSDGISNLLSLHGTSDLGWALAHEFDGMHPWESLDRWWRVSPIAHVHHIRTPLLLVHAEDDGRVPVSQADELFTALAVLQRDVEMVRFPGETHGMASGGRPHNRRERLRRILDWFEQRL